MVPSGSESPAFIFRCFSALADGCTPFSYIDLSPFRFDMLTYLFNVILSRKKMKNLSKFKWYRTMSLIVFAAVFTAGCATTEKRNVASQLAVAKTAVADAVSSGAPELAPVEFKSAQENLDAAEKASMASDYKKAIRLGENAQLNAQLASAKARAAKAQQAADALKDSNRALQDEMNRTAK